MKTYARYKDSGISWIGKIPEHWEVLRLKNTVALICEKTSDSTLPYIGLENIVSWSGELLKGSYEPDADANKFEKDDVLFSKLRPYLAKCFLADFTGKCSSELLVFRNFHGENRFLKNILLSYGFVDLINASTYGTKMPRANWSFIGNCRIPIPPLSEQKAIADFLDEKTAKINELVAAKQKQIELLKEYKQSLIANAVTKGINPKAKMKDSGINWIGQIPAHWELSRIRHYFAESDEKTFDESATLLSLSQYTGISLKSESPKIGMSEAETTEGYKVVHKGQFVMNIMLAWNGSYAVSDLDGVISPAYCVFDFVKDCDKWYFHYLLRIKAYSGAFKTLSKGIIDSRLRLYPNKFYTFPLIVPPIDEQKQIVAFINERVASIDTQISSIEKQIVNLNEYKQSLISDVVTGKVKV